MQNPQPLLPHEATQVGDYQLLGRLGEGGQGVVYLGKAPSGDLVAVKMLHARFTGDAAARERFLREVASARRVAEFSTARVLDASTDGDRPFIVSEYVEGVSLDQLIKDSGPRQAGALERLAVGTMAALAAIHRAGVVHRDFKPSNVLLGLDGPRVIDFGIAKALDATTASASGLIGTPAFMSPEQISGEPVGPPSDLFAWAVTIMFAATGRPAFGGDSVPAIFNRILTKEPDLSGLQEPLLSLVAACLAKDPADRPTAAEAMLVLIGHDPTVPGRVPVTREAPVTAVQGSVDWDDVRPAVRDDTDDTDTDPGGQPGSMTTIAPAPPEQEAYGRPRRNLVRTLLLAVVAVILASSAGVAVIQMLGAGGSSTGTEGSYQAAPVDDYQQVPASEPPTQAKKRVTLPDLSGLGIDEVEARLEKLGLKCKIVEVSHDKVQPGSVIETRPGSGSVARGTLVTVYLSVGPAEENVPTPAPEPTPTPSASEEDEGGVEAEPSPDPDATPPEVDYTEEPSPAPSDEITKLAD